MAKKIEPDTGEPGDRHEDLLPTREEIASLPRRARVAFAARCARRVQPLFQALWPQAPHADTENIEIAILAAESGGGKTLSEPERALLKSIDAVGAAEAGAASRKAGIGEAAALVGSAADSAYLAHYLAYDRSEESEPGSIDNAVSAARSSAAAMRAAGVAGGRLIRDDFERLKLAAVKESWTDETPAPPEFFGPLWPDGEPEGWPAGPAVEPTKDEPAFKEASSLSLYFDLDEFTPEQIATFIRLLSEVYHDLGGDELIIDDSTILEFAAVPEVVS